MTGNSEDFSNVQYIANKFNFEFVVLWVVTLCNCTKDVMSEAACPSKFCYPPTRLHIVTTQNTTA